MKSFFLSILFFSMSCILATSSSHASPLDFLYGSWEGISIKGVKPNAIERNSSECNHAQAGSSSGVIQARHIEVLSTNVQTEDGTLTPTNSLDKFNFWMKKENSEEISGMAQIDSAKQIATLTITKPGGKPGVAVYTITVKENQWTEIGIYSADGRTNWIQIYEMKLTKKEKQCLELKK